jgi:drug/metabolite transporter (DMT)-like permease
MSAGAIVARKLTDNASDTLRGIGLVCLCYLAMTIGDTGGKFALPAAGVAGVMIFRGILGAGAVTGLATLPSAALRDGRRGWRLLMPRRTGMVMLRSVLHTAVSFAWYLAWEKMSLADSYAIGFTAPLLMTLLAVPMLGERLRWRRMLSTLIGFGGVLIMVRPGGHLWMPVTAILLLGIAGMAISRILARMLSTTESAECLSFWLLAMHVPAGLLLMASGAFPAPGMLSPADWMAILVLGVGNAMGHFLLARGYALAPVAALAPYEYTSLIWGGVLGFMVFGDIPALSTLAGAAVVAAAGLYNLHRERLRRAAEARI